jgi:tRNA dimethylallyltransferase
VILGATASGKSELAMALARRLRDLELVDLELVSVDSMQVYRGMDIGTATPSADDRAEFPHHLIDLVEPTEEFTVGAFQAAALSTLADIRARGAIPVLVGGTGLYVRSVVDQLDIPGRYPRIRAQLEATPDTELLHRELLASDPVAAARMEPSNRRRIVRALEVTRGAGRPFSSFGPGLGDYPDTPFVQVGLRWDRTALDERIAARYQRQLDAGFLDEVVALARVELSRTAAQALGYKELLAHVRGDISLEEAVAVAVSRTRRFARRQERWFRRDPRIRWLDAPAPVDDVVGIWDAAIDSRVG